MCTGLYALKSFGIHLDPKQKSLEFKKEERVPESEDPPLQGLRATLRAGLQWGTPYGFGASTV